MTVIKYEAEKHLEIIQEWAKARGVQIIPELLSKNGFMVVDEDENPIMASWVYFVLEVPVIQIDNLIAKPDMSIFEIRGAWGRMFNCILDFIRIAEETTGIKYSLIRSIMSARLKKEAKRCGFIIDENPISACLYIL